MQRAVMGDRVAGAQQPVNHPRLTSHFGGEPTRQDGDKAGRSQQQREAVEQALVIQATAQTQHQTPDARQNHQQAHRHHNAEGPENDSGVRTIFRREAFQRRDLLSQAMGQNQAAQHRDFDSVFRFFRFHIRQAEQDQRRRFARRVFPVAFNRGDFRRLVLQGIQAMGVADARLNRRDDQRHPHRHREHTLNGRAFIAAQQMPCARCADEEGGGKERSGRHMQQTVRERGVKDHFKPVCRNQLTVNHFITLRRVHKAVGGKDPEGRHQGAQRHHTGREEVQPWPDAIPAEHHHPKEASFQEEGGQHLISQQRAGDTARKGGESAPVGAELIGHHQTGYHPHTKVHSENLQPEMIQIAPGFITGF